MNLKKLTIGAMALTLCSVMASARADDMVESAQYKAWKDYKPGASVTMTMDMKMGAMNMSSEMKQTLKEVTPNDFTVTAETKMNGQAMPGQPMKQPAKVKAGHEMFPEGFDGKAEVVGKESVTVAGKAYECEVVQLEGEQQGNKMKGKIWRTMDIPGGVAKAEMMATTPQGDMTINMMTTAFEAMK